MPFEGNHANDIGLTLSEGPVCKFDCENGKLKSPEAIFMGGVEWYAGEVTQGNRALAARLTCRNMNSLAYWKNHHCSMLEGPQATDEEYRTAMVKL